LSDDNYDAHRGWLASKLDNNGKGSVNTYTAAGRLEKRAWARGTKATYTANPDISHFRVRSAD
jgi:hypothetical protein